MNKKTIEFFKKEDKEMKFVVKSLTKLAERIDSLNEEELKLAVGAAISAVRYAISLVGALVENETT